METYFTLATFDYETTLLHFMSQILCLFCLRIFLLSFSHRYGTAKHICEEQGLKPFYHKVPNPPYPTPKNSKEPLATEDPELDANSNTVEDLRPLDKTVHLGPFLNEVLAKYSDHIEGNSHEHFTGHKVNVS